MIRIVSLTLLIMLTQFPAFVRANDKSDARDNITYDVPYKLTNTAHLLVRVKIDNKGPFNFIIDTGAPIVIVSKEVGDKLGLQTKGPGWANVKRFTIEGGVESPDQKMLVKTIYQMEGMNALNLAGVEIQGVIGFPLLAKYKMEIDLSQNKMRWTDLDYTPPAPQPLKNKPAPSAGMSGMVAMGKAMRLIGMLVGKLPSPVIVKRGLVGIELRESEKGLVIRKVLRNSPAAMAGLQVGDRITKIKGNKVRNLEQVRSEIRKVRAGRQLKMSISREGESRDITLTTIRGI